MLRRFYALLAAFTLLTTISTAQVVDIPDDNLERAIRETLQIPVNTLLTRDHLMILERLSADEKRIVDLTGLEHATNLVGLTLWNNQIRDITPISGLTKINFLIIADNPIESLEPLANLTEITNLNVAGIAIQDLSVMSRLKKLRGLTAINCQLSDISPLSELTELEWLDLTGNQIVDVGPLAGLTRLETLRMSHNWVVDIGPLTNLTSLSELYITHNRIVDASPIAELTNLTTVEIQYNQIVDHSPLDFLTLGHLERDEQCIAPRIPIQPRIDNRNLPSVFDAWGDNLVSHRHLPIMDNLVRHDLHVSPFFLELPYKNTPDGFHHPAGDMLFSVSRWSERLSRNPSTILLAEIRQRDAHVSDVIYPKDWPYWLRDGDGNVVSNRGWTDVYLIDFRIPEVQDIIVEQAIAVSQCGLYDGIFFDWWSEGGGTLVDYAPRGDSSPNIAYSAGDEEFQARLSILRRIRDAVPDDFFIVGNHNRRTYPVFSEYMNGSFMETLYDPEVDGYTRRGIIEIETNLIWLERNMREPQINLLEADGIYTEPADSPLNKQYMRLFTTMSLTCSDGYVLYNTGAKYMGGADHTHIWYDFWDADLGQPVSPIARLHNEIDGLYIREFTNGWAMYNRSGSAHIVEFSEQVQSVQSGLENDSHAVLDLDGDIFIRIHTNPFDLNGDGIVNILDLVLVAQSLGTGENDVNGDGVTNVFDLVIIANAINQ